MKNMLKKGLIQVVTLFALTSASFAPKSEAGAMFALFGGTAGVKIGGAIAAGVGTALTFTAWPDVQGGSMNGLFGIGWGLIVLDENSVKSKDAIQEALTVGFPQIDDRELIFNLADAIYSKASTMKSKSINGPILLTAAEIDAILESSAIDQSLRSEIYQNLVTGDQNAK